MTVLGRCETSLLMRIGRMCLGSLKAGSPLRQKKVPARLFDRPDIHKSNEPFAIPGEP